MNAITLAAAAAFACTLDRKAFTAALNLADKVTEARNTIPILSTVRLDVAGDTLRIEATDLDLSIIQPLAAAETIAGAICVDMKALRATVRKMTGARVRLQYVGGRVVVADADTGATTRLATLPVKDWPVIAVRDSPCAFAVPAVQLVNDLSRVRPAISTEETRYYLNGIHFHAYNDCYGRDMLRMVATDGHRLHWVTRPLSPDMAGLPPVILPRKAVAVALAIMGKKPAGDVALSFSESRFAIALGTIELRGKLIDGTFPDYTRVIPTMNEKRLLIGADDVAELSAAATAHCGDKSRAVTLSLCTESVIFSATDAENGVAAVQAPAASFEGEELAIGFNAAYLADVAKQFAGASLTVELADSAAPTLFRSDDGTFAAVLMPMRVGCEGSIMRPGDIERLNRGPWEVFTGEIGEAIDRAQRGICSWSTVAAMVRDARAFLVGGGMSPIGVRGSILSVITPDSRKQRAATAMAEADGPCGSFAALSSVTPAVVVQPVEAEAEPETIAPPLAQPEPVEDEAPAAPEADDAPEGEEAPQETPAAPEAATVPADAYAALLARVEALEARFGSQPPAEISAPDPTAQPAQDPAPIKDGERAVLVAEIDRLRATVASQAERIDSLEAAHTQAAASLSETTGALQREKTLTEQLLGQVANMLKRRELAGDVEPLPAAIALPASLRPDAIIELPPVASRPRVAA